jgi:hypothetical protein
VETENLCAGGLTLTHAAEPAASAPKTGTRRISGAASDVSPRKAASKSRTESTVAQLRVVRVALAPLPDETWIELRRLAYQCAAFGNALLSEQYIAAKQKGVKFSTYTDFSDKLSAAIRDAVGREVQGIWRRLGKVILRGEQTLARFTADRAVVIRDRGVRLERRPSGSKAESVEIIARLRLHPQDEGEATELPLWMGAMRDAWYKSLIDRLTDGELRIAKGTLVFERPGHKIFLLIAYEQQGSKTERTEVWSAVLGRARIGIDDEQMWLRDEAGHRKSLTDYLHRLISHKTDFADLHRRLRMGLGRRRHSRNTGHLGPSHRAELRQALVKAGSYETWARGVLHEMSHEIVEWCVAQDVSALDWELPTDGMLPWAGLREMAAYKAREHGIEVAQMRPGVVAKDPLRKMKAVKD